MSELERSIVLLEEGVNILSRKSYDVDGLDPEEVKAILVEKEQIENIKFILKEIIEELKYFAGEIE